jgi:hypothetical protein
MFERPKNPESKDQSAQPKPQTNRPLEPIQETHRPRLFVGQEAHDIALKLGHNDPDRVQEFLNNEDR